MNQIASGLSYSSPVVELAKEAAGNWNKFESFAWHDKPENPDSWAIVYTHNRDSGLLDQSNADVIAKAMEPFIKRGAARSESHNHWACGWVAGFAIRVFTSKGRITQAFRKWCELQARLEDYPILNEEDYFQRELNATFENIAQAGKRFLCDNPPDDWAEQVYDALPDCEKENRDDQGGCPSDEALKDALWDLGLLDKYYEREVVERNGPQEGDIVTVDGGMSYWQDNKCILERQSDGAWFSPLIGKPIDADSADEALQAWMEIDQSWPNVWNVSDHGNARLLDLN